MKKIFNLKWNFVGKYLYYTYIIMTIIIFFPTIIEPIHLTSIDGYITLIAGSGLGMMMFIIVGDFVFQDLNYKEKQD